VGDNQSDASVSRDRLVDITITAARSEHVERIYQIARNWRPEGRASESLSREGFLVSDFTRDQYEGLVRQSDHAFVAASEHDVVGFLLGYRGDQARLFDDYVATTLAPELASFVVAKQIAVDPANTNRGVGRRLYRFLMARLGGRSLIAATVDDPPNNRSRALHRGLGFIDKYHVRHPDGRNRTVWRYDPE
jgi:predicted GNAT superfamily acetyltransferase